MSDGQWRVFVLLLVLLGMEALRSKNVSGFFNQNLVQLFIKSGK